MATIIVLLLLSITLAMSYAMMRTQSVAVQIQRNAARAPAARQDALTGMIMALKKMHMNAWAGIAAPLTGTLGPYDSYQVTFATGDPSLSSGNANYSDYPYRVTLVSTGSSLDPDNPQCVARYKIQAVVHLVPRALSAEPASWSTMLNYTVYQTALGFFDPAVPSQIQGPVYTQAVLDMSHSIWANDGGPLDQCRQRYYADLNPFRTATGTDWRPYTGQVSFEMFIQYSDTNTNLSNLGITLSQYWSWSGVSWNPPSQSFSYQLYPGGQTYNAGSLAASLQGVSLQPDVINNPLGIYYRAGPVSLGANTTFYGTLITQYAANADVTIQGTGISLTAVSLPALYGTTTPVQLPVIASGNNLYVNANTNATINGQACVAATLDVDSAGQAATVMALSGQVITAALDLEPRTEWLGHTSGWWQGKYNAFMAQKSTGYKYFPQYLQKTAGVDPTPQLIIKPAAAPVRYHWQTWNGTQGAANPIFVPASGDTGLHWDLLGWAETPGG
ncbi:MAG: hypothetical protein ABR915_22760 [Thermoguttaceae bacterium]|jgi:hypothetical protein